MKDKRAKQRTTPELIAYIRKTHETLWDGKPILELCDRCEVLFEMLIESEMMVEKVRDDG